MVPDGLTSSMAASTGCTLSRPGTTAPGHVLPRRFTAVFVLRNAPPSLDYCRSHVADYCYGSRIGMVLNFPSARDRHAASRLAGLSRRCGRYFAFAGRISAKRCRKFMQSPPAPCAIRNKILILLSNSCGVTPCLCCNRGRKSECKSPNPTRQREFAEF